MRVVGVARFQQDGDREHKLEALKHAHSWMRGSFVTDQGWATMPGADKPGAGVAVECDPDSRHQAARNSRAGGGSVMEGDATAQPPLQACRPQGAR